MKTSSSPGLLVLLATALTTALISAGCGTVQAYPGPPRPKDKTAMLFVNPPQATIGFQLTAVNGRPVNADVSVSILPGSNRLDLVVWPTSSSTFQDSDPAFATHYQMIDQEYRRMMSITFDAAAAGSYGLSGQFNQGDSPSESSYAIEVFDQGTNSVVATANSGGLGRAAEDKVDAAVQSSGEQWSVEAGPGS